MFQSCCITGVKGNHIQVLFFYFPKKSQHNCLDPGFQLKYSSSVLLIHHFSYSASCELFTVTKASPIMRCNHWPLNHFLWINTHSKSLCFLKGSINQFLLVMFSLSTAISSELIKSRQIISLGFISPKLSFFHPRGHGRMGNACWEREIIIH